jgi:serine/threonine protein kinase
VEKPVYSTKVDIWAMGVILHELVTGKKPFATDLAVWDHYRSKKLPEIRLDRFEDPFKTAVRSSICEMLQKEPRTRPTAKTLFQRFSQFYIRTATRENTTSETRTVVVRDQLLHMSSGQLSRGIFHRNLSTDCSSQ